RMVEADPDQPFRNRQRDQALCRLARDAKLGGDLVLRVAGDIVEPAGTGCVVKPAAAAFLSRTHAFIPPATSLAGISASRNCPIYASNAEALARGITGRPARYQKSVGQALQRL